MNGILNKYALLSAKASNHEEANDEQVRRTKQQAAVDDGEEPINETVEHGAHTKTGIEANPAAPYVGLVRDDWRVSLMLF